jgi:uncharacterized membrane protein
MDPITGTIDKIEQAIGHSPHTAIIALPLGAWAVSNVADGLYLTTGNKAFDDAANVSMAVGLVGAAGSVLTGLRDYGYIPPHREPNHSIATTHALGNAAVGSLFVSSYILRVRDRAAGRRSGALPRLLSFAGGALSLYTAWLGGKLVSEYGEAVKPLQDQQKEADRKRLQSQWQGKGNGHEQEPARNEPAHRKAGSR